MKSRIYSRPGVEALEERRLCSSGTAGGVTGLKAEYFNNANFTGTSITRIDSTVNFNWGSGSPDPAISANTFSARWTGQITPPQAGVYSFLTSTDDGVRLWVNNQLLIDKWRNQSGDTHTGTLYLAGKRAYNIRMEYYENRGGAIAQLQWTTTGIAKQIVPTTALSPEAGYTLPSTGVIRLPRVTTSLRAHVNLNHHSSTYFDASPERISSDPFVTDLSTLLKQPSGAVLSTTEAKAKFTSALSSILRANPTAVVGTYISSRLVKQTSQLHSWPADAVQQSLFTESEFLPYSQGNEPGRLVDYRQPTARAKLINAIVQQAVTRGQPVLFTDNWTHDSSWPGFIPWKTTVAYMSELRRALNAQGIAMVTNVAIALGNMPDADIQALATSTDGMTLEMVLTSWVTSSSSRLRTAIEQYKTLVKADTRLVFIPLGSTNTSYDREAQFLAGLAAVLDGPMVAYPFFRSNPAWHKWPERLGNPTGEIVISGSIITRTFEGGTIRINCSSRTANLI